MPKDCRILVLGAGRVGSVIAADLARDERLRVTVADASADAVALVRGARTVVADLADAAQLSTLVADHDVVVGALPSALGLSTLKAVIEAGRSVCDISFMAEDPLQLDALARERGVTVVVDCGVTPGISNLLVGHADSELDRTERVDILVGGLPRERRWPYAYKAGFDPRDVIEEYTRPARLVEHGEVVVREAMSEPELVDFDGIGTLEAFNTDGLRSLLTTIDAPWRREKTLRYPGHIELMRAFRHTGLFDSDPIAVGASGVTVRPVDVLAALLFPKWTLDEGEVDVTVMRVRVEGEAGGQTVRYGWDLFDELDPETGRTSMSRTTGFPCAIVTRMIADGTFAQPGVHPPEVLGRQRALVDRVLEQLAARGVMVTQTMGPEQR